MDTTTKKRIALITTWFPPQKGIAVSRMQAFATYLSEHFIVEVFALDQKKHSEKINSNLFAHYEKSYPLFERLKSNQADAKWKHNLKTLLRVLLNKIITNPLNTWRKSILIQLQDRHALAPFDCVISSYSPEDAHLVALDFCKKNKGIEWIADMRDEMSLNPFINPVAKIKLAQIEQEINQYATVITSVSEPILKQFEDLCPKVKTFIEVRNGYNHSIQFDVKEKQSNTFKMGYFGSFYGARKPDIFFKALAELKSEHRIQNFEVHIYGAHNNYEIPNEIKQEVLKHEGLNYLDAIKKMNQLDANVLIHPRSNQKGVYSGKIFDYISAQKSVLACVDVEDVAAQLINQLNCGYIAEFEDVKMNKEMILTSYNDFVNQKMRVASSQDILLLHRKVQIDKLVKYIQEKV